MDALRAAAEHPGPLASRDGHLQIVVARTRYPADDLAHNAPALAAARAAADEARATDVRAGVAGDVITSAEEHRALSGGMVQATLFTTAIVAGGLLLFFGAAAPVLALLGALAVGALVTFAFALGAVGHLNLATAFLAPIVVGNGINFGIILLARHLEERRAGHPPDVALARAVAGSFGGTLAAALTASVSYASLLATQFRGFRHFGVIGGVGIMLCWGATFVVLPAAIAALEARGWIPAARRRRSAGQRRWVADAVAGAARAGGRGGDRRDLRRRGRRCRAVSGEPPLRDRLQEPALQRRRHPRDPRLERHHRRRLRSRNLGRHGGRAALGRARPRSGRPHARRRRGQAGCASVCSRASPASTSWSPPIRRRSSRSWATFAAC